MKTQEEIKQLTETLYPTVTMYTQPLRIGFEGGYTQCQQDMDKKYTEEDMLKAFEKGSLYGSTKNGNTHYFDEVISSLNKQD